MKPEGIRRDLWRNRRTDRLRDRNEDFSNASGTDGRFPAKTVQSGICTFLYTRKFGPIYDPGAVCPIWIFGQANQTIPVRRKAGKM